MYKGPSVGDRINSFALVTYIPEPLAGFLDRLRQELVPNCFLRAHATILPPRPLSSTPEAAWETVRSLAPRFAPFDLQLSEVCVFPVSDVVFVGMSSGCEELVRMHDAMNVDGLRFQEPYPFHPHITLGQDLKTDEVDELTTVARARWAEFQFGKSFRIDKVVFVQNTRRGEWVDLGECCLGKSESKLVGELVGVES
jgi:2'-5' RNA ligase